MYWPSKSHIGYARGACRLHVGQFNFIGPFADSVATPCFNIARDMDVPWLKQPPFLNVGEKQQRRKVLLSWPVGEHLCWMLNFPSPLS
jgi:hypothetical protein